MNSFVKNVFIIVGAMLLAMLLYTLFFVGNNSVLNQACRAMERPISFYYYMYSYYPSVHVDDGIENSLGVDTTSTGMTSDLTIVDTDNSSVIAPYSTGWR